MNVRKHKIKSFAAPSELDIWMAANHGDETELWVRIYKRTSGIESLSWNDCVEAGIAWGWIDGLRKSLDDQAYLQRMTPRKMGSNWSKRNKEIAETLIRQGRMQSAGLVQVAAAKKNGHWNKAYSGSSEFVIPQDFLEKLPADSTGRKTFESLDRKNRYAIYYRLQTASNERTRSNRMERMLAMLERGETIH